MVDVEYLQKNYPGYDVEVIECLENIRNDFEEYSMANYEGDKEDVREYQNDIYTELIFLLAYLRIAGIDFGSRQFKEDMYSTLQYLQQFTAFSRLLIAPSQCLQSLEQCA